MSDRPDEVKPDVLRAVGIVGEIPFAGRAVARKLLESGVAARVLCPDAEAERAITSLPGAELAEIVKGCVDSEEAVARALAGTGGVCFVSPVTLNGRIYRADTHLDDVRRVLHAAELLLLRKFVYHSCVNAHPSAQSRAIRDAAAAEELLTKSRCEDYFIRTGPLMGEGDRFLAEIAETARKGSPIMTIVGYGGAEVQPLHVEDFAAALARIFAGAQETLRNGVYELIGAEKRSVMDLTDTALELARRAKIKIHAPLFLMQLLASITGSRRLRERVALETDILISDKNEYARLMGTAAKLKSVREVQEHLAKG